MSRALRFASLLALACVAGPVATAATPEPPPEGRFCDENPVKCEEMRQQYDKYCVKYPETCAAAEERREERRAFCKKNPDKCQDVVADEKRQRSEEMRDYCQANPHECENEEAYQRAERRYREFCRENMAECKALEPERRTGPPR